MYNFYTAPNQWQYLNKKRNEEQAKKLAQQLTKPKEK